MSLNSKRVCVYNNKRIWKTKDKYDTTSQQNGLAENSNNGMPKIWKIKKTWDVERGAMFECYVDAGTKSTENLWGAPRAKAPPASSP